MVAQTYTKVKCVKYKLLLSSIKLGNSKISLY